MDQNPDTYNVMTMGDGELPAEILDQFPTATNDYSDGRTAESTELSYLTIRPGNWRNVGLLIVIVHCVFLSGIALLAGPDKEQRNCLLIYDSTTAIFNRSEGVEIVGYIQRNRTYEVISESDTRIQIEAGWIEKNEVQIKDSLCTIDN